MPQYITEETIIGDPIHEWAITEYEKLERGQSWHIAMISIGLALVVYGIFSNNFVFSLIIILVAIIFYLQSNQPPTEMSFLITDTGVVIGGKFYPYKELDEFYIIYNPPEVKKLYITTKSSFRPLLRIPLNEANPIEIRDTLNSFLMEDPEKEDEPLSDILARRFKLL